MSQHNPHYHHPHPHPLHYQQQQQQQQQQQLHHHLPSPQQQQQQQHKQIQHNQWYSHVASTSSTTPYPHHSSSAGASSSAAGATTSGSNNNHIMNAYGTHGYYGAAGGGLNVNAVGVAGGGGGNSNSYNLEAANTVAYAHNQLLQYQQQQHQQQQQQHHQQQQQQQQHHLSGRSYMGGGGHHPHHSHPHHHHHHPHGIYPYIKSEPMEYGHNTMAPPPAPSGSTEMRIKSEPMDELAYKSSNYIDDNTPFADFTKYNEFNENMLSPKVEMSVKNESTPYSKNSNNYPRRKLQTERSSENLPICQRCKEVFFKKQSYLRHVAESSCNIHEYEFKCNICPMSFMSGEELQRHKHLHRADKFFCHKYCGKHFDTIAECESHEYMQHEYDSFVCNMCSMTFATREQLYTHLPQHKFQQRYDCPICRLWYQTALELHEHRLAAPYFCGKYYNTGQQQQQQHQSQQQQQQQQQQQHHLPQQQQQQQQPHQTNYKLQDCHMATMEMPTGPPPSVSAATGSHHKTNANSSSSSSSTLPATAALSSLLQQRQANADGSAMFAAAASSSSSSKGEVNVKLERSYSNSTSDSSYGMHDISNTNYNNNNSSNNNAYGSDNSIHGSGAIGGPQAHSSTLDDSEDALCCVPMCGVSKSTSPTLQFFTFPKDDKYLHQWLHNLKMFHIPASSYTSFRICSMHFPKRCINRYSLCYWAVPTFNLGHDDVANLYQNRELTNTFTTGEVARCSMPHCNSQRGESNLKFYNFPKDIKSLIKWCQNARLPVQAKEPRHFCSRHFEERCIGKFRLKPWAVPTLHLGGAQYGKIHDNPKNLYVEEKRCCLNFCRRSRSTDFNMSLYRFPRNEVLLRRWCYNLRLDPAVYRGKNHKICSAHFIKEALGLRKLSPGAVPTLHLGHNDTFNIYENELWPPPTPSSSSTPHHHHQHLQQQQQQQQHHHALQQHHHNKAAYQRQTAASTSSSASSASHYVDPDNMGSGGYLGMGGNSLTGGMNVSDSMDVCCVPSCESKRHNSENITFHTIPRRPEQMRKWCHNLKIPEDKMHKGMRICSLHFEPYCIGGCMRPFAVPTLHLGHDDTDIHRNPDVIKKLNIRETCCVAVCKRNRDRDHANLHRFPSNVALLTKWCANLQRPVPDGSKLFNDAICEVHFEDRCLRNKRLEKWAVPTLMLGHEDIAYELPTSEQVAEFYARPHAPNNGEEQGECCVESCKRNPSVDDIKLYRPPEESDVLAKWAHNLEIGVAELPNMRICNLHFESHCIGKRMRPWAIPTLNLSSNIENLYENPEHSMLYKRRTRRDPNREISSMTKPTWVPRCCLPHCRKVRALHNVQLYRFPKLNRSTLAKWAHNLQVPMVGSAQRRLCSAHFEPHVLSKKCPVPLAVPTIDLNAPPGYKIYQNPAKLKATKLCLQRVCIVESCRRTRAQGVQLFRLPHSPTQLRKWMHNIKTRPRAATRSQYRICSIHFESHSFNGKRLSAGAIPTLELGHDDDDIYPNEAQAFVDEHCAVESCESSKDQPEVRLFRFPTEDDDLLWKWCNNLKMNPVDCVGVRICNKHFEVDCIGPKHLFKWAIPTLELGHDDAQIELIPNPKPEERYVDPVFKCCVPTCGKTRKFDEVQMNSFPKDPLLFQRWRHNLRLEHLIFKERDRYKICNDHFEDVCIGKTRLNIGSIPTINLGHNETEDLYQVDPAELQSNLFGRPRRLHGSVDIKLEPMDDTDMQHDVKPNLNAMAEATDINTRQVKIKKSLADLKCCVRSCGRSRLEHGARLFPFPSGKQQQLKWRHNLQLEPDEVDKLTRVCSAHFNRRCIDGKQLRAWAMPTQQLGHHQEQPIYENPKNIPGFFTPTCALSHCRKRRSIDNDLRTYRYPRSEDLLEKWRANLHLTPDQCRGRICADHFEPLVRGKLKLKTGAVPTLKLGHDEELVYDNEAIKASMADEEEGSLESSPKIIPKKEIFEDEDDEDDPHHEADAGDDDEEEDDAHENAEDHEDSHSDYFDPLELVETYADDPVPDDEYTSPAPHRPHHHQHHHHLLPPPPPSIGVRREKPANNVTPICCLRHCRKERTPTHQLSTFGFPKDHQLLLKWCANLHLEPVDCVGRVCIEHFEAEMLGTRKLKQNAVPTINVGHQMPLPYTCNGQERINDDDDDDNGDDEVEDHSDFRLWSLKHCRKRKLTEPPDIRPKLEKNDVIPMMMMSMGVRVKKEKMEDGEEQQQQQQMMMTTMNKPKKCCLSQCGKMMDLQKFPRDFHLLRKWLHNLKLSLREDLDPAQLRVCLEHFEPHLVRNGQLAREALPTLKLGHNDKNIYQTTVATSGGCLVASCPCARLNLYRSYALPQNPHVREAWLTYLKQPPTTQGQLCVMHFMQLYEDMPFEELRPIYESIANSTQALKLRCAVPGCNSKYTDNIHLTKLPQNQNLLEKWLHNTMLNYDPGKHSIYRICLLHFEPDALGPACPKPWAVPTLELNHQDDIFFNPTKEEIMHLHSETPLQIKTELTLPLRIKTELAAMSSPSLGSSPSPRGKVRICCIQSCLQQANSQLRLYRFPNTETALLKWLVNTQQQPRLVDPLQLYVCQTHFEPEAICKKQLRSWAIPTLNLGHDGHVIPNARHNGNIADSQETEQAMEFIRANYCSVLTCFQPKSEALRLHPYPKDMPTIRRWAANCKHRSMQASSHGFQVCQLHFETDCFDPDSGDLLKGAVPTLDLTVSRVSCELRCLVAGCIKDESLPRRRYHKLPKRSALLGEWCVNLGLDPATLPQNVEHNVCERHFESRCFNTAKQLRPGARPTLHLGHTEDIKLLPNPEIFSDEVGEEVGCVCCVPECGASRESDETLQFSSFPKMRKLSDKWIYNLHLPFVGRDQLAKLRVCHRHFEASCFENGHLRQVAMPTLELGHQDTDIYQTDDPNLGKNRKSNKVLPGVRITGLDCCYPQCIQLQKNYQRVVHDLPKEEKLRRRWLQHLEIEDTEERPLKLCPLHFIIVYDYSQDNFEEHVADDVLERNYEDARNGSRIRLITCAVRGCGTLQPRDGGRLHGLPTNPEVFQMWLENTELVIYEPQRYMIKVCSKHFEPQCFTDIRKLKCWSVPTLHLPGEVVHQNPTEEEWQKLNEKLAAVPAIQAREDCDESSMLEPVVVMEENSVCCVPDCGRSKQTDESIQFTSFPKRQVLCEKWLYNFRLKVPNDQWANLRVCYRHFEPSCFENGRIRIRYAMPTLELGHENSDIYHTEEPDFHKIRKPTKQRTGAQDCSYPQCVELLKNFQRMVYNLPKEPQLRQSWLEYMELKETGQPLKLCPLHYIILYDHSVKHFEAHAPEKLLDFNYESARNCVRIRIISCSVQGCNTLQPRDGGRMHGLPPRSDILQMWLDNTRLPFHEHQRYMLKVCSKHFEPKCFTDIRKLKSWSIPTLHLPDEPVHQNLTEKEWQQMNERFAEANNREAESFDENSMLEPIVMMEHAESDGEIHDKVVEEEQQENNTQTLHTELVTNEQHLQEDSQDIGDEDEMQALEVLLEVGHVEKCSSYEKMDNNKSHLSYSETGPLSPSLASVLPGQRGGGYGGGGGNYNARHCSVQGCQITANDVDGNIKLHKFPTSLEATQKWMHNTQVDVDENYSWRYRICSYHFEQDCFNGARIRRGSMPTLHLGPLRPKDIYKNEFPQMDMDETGPTEATNSSLPGADEDERVVPHIKGRVTQLCLPRPAPPRKSSKYCQIEGCSNHLTSENMTLHKFPHSLEMCARWQHNTQVPFDPEYRWRYRICSIHFHPACLVNMRLVHGSVPTRKLGPRAPAQLFDNDFEAINMRLDKRSQLEQGTRIKQEKPQPQQQQQQQTEGLHLEPEMEMEVDEDEDDEQDQDHSQSMTSFDSWRHQLRLPAVKPEKTPYNPIKSGYDKCSLPHCQRQRSQHGVHIYKFPKSRRHQQRWMHNLRIRYDERKPWKYMICSVHFEPNCIRLRKLRPWAVPTLELGKNVADQIYTNEQCQEMASDVSEEEEEEESGHEESLQEDDDDEADLDGDTAGVETHVKRERRPWGSGAAAGGGQMAPWKVKQCCLPYCRRPRGDGIKLFRLPSNPNSIRNWEKATGMTFKASQRNTRLICSRHFEPELMGVRRLMRNAIPTRHLYHQRESYSPELVIPTDTPAPIGPTCCIPDCPAQDGSAQLHRFPSDPQLLQQWCESLKLGDPQQYSEQYVCSNHLPGQEATSGCIVCGAEDGQLPLLDFPENRNHRAKWCYNLKIDTIPKWDNSKQICSKHFESYCFNQQTGELNPEAAPTLHLNHNDSNIFLNDYAIDQHSMMRIKDEPLDNDEMLLA